MGLAGQIINLFVVAGTLNLRSIERRLQAVADAPKTQTDGAEQQPYG